MKNEEFMHDYVMQHDVLSNPKRGQQGFDLLLRLCFGDCRDSRCCVEAHYFQFKDKIRIN